VRSNLIVGLIGLLCVVGCGGGGGSVDGGGNNTPTGANVQALVVDSGPHDVATSNSPAVNTLYTTVTICVPGTSTCQTIDHVQVDTGSSGLRILSSVLTLTLPLYKDSSGNGVAECTQFVDGSSWGALRTTDLKISGEVASNLAIQIIGDSAYTVPSGACPGDAENTVAAFGANGILGVSAFVEDCGQACTVAGHGVYYSCTSMNSCTSSAMPLNQQVKNPVVAFATDNNGVIIQVGSVSSTAASVTGSLIFGIGTQGNNGLGSAKVLMVSESGSFTTTYKGSALSNSFIDSGSNAYFFPDSSIKVCPDGTTAAQFFCPGSTLNLTATLGSSGSVNFTVADANSLFSGNTTVAAAAGLAAPTSLAIDPSSSLDPNQVFDWGLPFYFGRSVYTAIDKQNTSAGMGPYFAF
jgi:hypothetical protein